MKELKIIASCRNCRHQENFGIDAVGRICSYHCKYNDRRWADWSEDRGVICDHWLPRRSDVKIWIGRARNQVEREIK